jgi:hypothetical protein
MFQLLAAATEGEQHGEQKQQRTSKSFFARSLENRWSLLLQEA